MTGFSAVSLPERTAEGIRRGDPDAQAEAYRLLAPKVLGMAQRILGDRGLAEEVVQDTFVSLIEHGNGLEQPGAAVGWIRQTAVNHCLMRLRSPWTRRRLPELVADELADGHSGDRAEGLRDLERALGVLGRETRMVLWLHDVEGYTHREIGQLFGRSESYSKSQLARGYRKLLDHTRPAERAGGERTGPEHERAAKRPGHRDGARAADLGPACAS